MNLNTIADFMITRPSILLLVNLILLSIWLPISIYGILRRNYPWFLLGIALFLLFSNNWLFFSLGMDIFTDFKYNVFFELLFLYGFFFLYLRVYEEREALGISSNLFHSRAPQIKNFNDFLYLQSDVFSALGGIVFFSSLYVLILMTDSAAVVAMFTFLYFLTIYFRVEKKCFYLEKDYAYFGSPWTQGRVLHSFRFFPGITAIIFGFYLIMAFGHFFDFWDFKEAFLTYIDVFFLMETTTVLFLIFFTLRLFTTKQKLQKKLEQVKKNYSLWLQQTLTGFEEITPESHPQYYYPVPSNPTDNGILYLFTKILDKSQADLIYLIGENEDWPNLRMVGRKDHITVVKKKPLFDLTSFDLEYYFPGLTTLIEHGRPLFFPNIEERSFAFRRHFAKLIKSHPDYSLRSLIIFPFTHQEKPATLVLVNPQFSREDSFQPLEYEFLTLITNALSKVDFAKLINLNLANQNQSLYTSSKSVVSGATNPSITVTDPWGFAKIFDKNDTNTKFIDTFSEYEENSKQPAEPEPGTAISVEETETKIFTSKKNRKKFIAEAQLESIYREQIEKVRGMFSPGKARASDKIEYHHQTLFKDRIPNPIALATNIKESGKLFVFNEFKQPPVLIAGSTMSLQNLFYEHPQKNVLDFMKEWHKEFKAFSKNEACYTLAMQFDQGDRIFSYYNAGVENAYFYDCVNKIFSPLPLHQNKVSNKITNFDKKKPINLDLQVGDFVVIFSSGMRGNKKSHRTTARQQPAF